MTHHKLQFQYDFAELFLSTAAMLKQWHSLIDRELVHSTVVVSQHRKHIHIAMTIIDLEFSFHAFRSHVQVAIRPTLVHRTRQCAVPIGTVANAQSVYVLPVEEYRSHLSAQLSLDIAFNDCKVLVVINVFIIKMD